MTQLLLGIDCGTSVVKSVLFDLDGQEVAAARRETPVSSPLPGRAEADMAAVWALTAETIQEVLRQADGHPVAAVGLCGTACGFWAVDAAGEPVRPAILWNDGRAADILNIWKEDGFFARLFDVSGNAPFPGYPLSLLRWLADHEPLTLERARWLLFHKDWLRFKLTGHMDTDVSDVSYFPGDLAARGYSQALLQTAGVGALWAKLPPVQKSESIVGTAQTLLPPGTPVVAGAVDVVASLIGGGAYRVGQACTILGTSMLNTFISAAPSLAPRETGVQAALPGGLFARSLVNTSGTMCIDWLLKTLAGEETRQAAEQGRSVYDLVEDTVQSAPPGARGLIFLPYLNNGGIVSPFADASARGQFFGLSVEHTRADLLRAVYEGVALAMRDCYEVSGQPLEEILLVGGGARSAFWAQLFADVTGRRIVIPAGSEFGARGAALLAGVGAGVYPSLAAAVQRAVHEGHTFVPRPHLTRVYDALYPLYCQLYRTARESWRLRQSIMAALG